MDPIINTNMHRAENLPEHNEQDTAPAWTSLLISRPLPHHRIALIDGYSSARKVSIRNLEQFNEVARHANLDIRVSKTLWSMLSCEASECVVVNMCFHIYFFRALYFPFSLYHFVLRSISSPRFRITPVTRHLTYTAGDSRDLISIAAMADISEESLGAAVALLQQLRAFVQLNSQDLDAATNRQMIIAVITSISEVMREAGVNPLSLAGQVQEREDTTQAHILPQAEVFHQQVARQAQAARKPAGLDTSTSNHASAVHHRSHQRQSSSTHNQALHSHKRLKLSTRQQERFQSTAASSSPVPERKSTLERKLEDLCLAEHVIEELRKGAESEPVARASLFAAPLPPKRMKADGKQSTMFVLDDG
jgi:hypothetical protein